MSTWYARSLREYVELVNCISQKQADGARIYPLWFRGQEQTGCYYYLEPGIYRYISLKKENNRVNDNRTYGTIWLKEEYRYQHFMARNYEKVSAMPDSLVEWQEIMQHYLTKTRLMDWSESAIVALGFALEAYINPLEDHETQYRRQNDSPVVWTLNPIGLNNAVYDSIGERKLVYRALPEVKKRVKEEIISSLKKNKEIYFDLDNSINGGVNGLISLSGLEALRKYQGAEIHENVVQQRFNPFFYLVLRYYSDGIGARVDELPPLAIIHPYHSARIHEQKGAFTIFPYYDDVPETELHTSPFAMENMSKINQYLDKIVIMNPWKVAGELKNIGLRRSHLYPEMDIVANDFENLRYTNPII